MIKKGILKIEDQQVIWIHIKFFTELCCLFWINLKYFINYLMGSGKSLPKMSKIDFEIGCEKVVQYLVL